MASKKKSKSLLDKYNKQARRNNIPAMTKKSREWFIDMLQAGELRGKPKKVLKDPVLKKVGKPMIGKIYTYRYVAKHKDTLPYWDEYPLIILVGRVKGQKNSFHGLNLHYLPPMIRAVFLSKLIKAYSTTTNINENTRLKISYSLLKSASKMRAFKPAFKQYLTTHVRSNIMEVPPEHWEPIIYLPFQKFHGAPTAKVWAESRKKIKM